MTSVSQSSTVSIDDILRNQSQQADVLMLWTLGFLTVITLVVGYALDNLGLALFVGLPALVMPWLVYRSAPGGLVTRLTTASALMVFAALQIQLSHGMVETHFGIFALLAFLLYYRDWRPLVMAAAVIAVHHVAFGGMQLMEIQGPVVLAGTVNPWIIVLHAAYVVFETAVLVFMAVTLRREAVESALVAKVAEEIGEGHFTHQDNDLTRNATPLLRKVMQMQKSLDSTLRDIIGVMQGVAEGKFHGRVTAEAKGDLDALKSNINSSIEAQQKVFENITQVMDGVAQGHLSSRITAQAKGDLATLKNNINQSIDSQQKVFQDISSVMNGVAQNNLTRRVTAEAKGDLAELKTDINASLDSLRNAMQVINNNARQVASASSQTSQAIGQISDGAHNQTHAISQVAAAVRETVTSVADVSRNTEVASQKSRESFGLVRSSMQKMESMVEVVNNIAANSEKINKITDVIEKIANKTNLLSLNAAIEAARAGEHGKGFAVVADEVGKLAVNSAESSQEIAVLVKQAVEEAHHAVAAVMAVNKDMSNIELRSQETDTMLQRIAAALEQQSAAVEEINANLSNVDQIAQSNASASEEITATVIELSKIADATRREVQQFQT
jgi:methyl-accepting chemotaxis protein